MITRGFPRIRGGTVGSGRARMHRFGPDDPHPLSLLRGEFVWEGKYDAQGQRREPRLPAPPPVIEPKEAWPGHGAGVAGSGPNAPNLLLGGDNLLALAALLPVYRGQVQLVYIDPPFDTGSDHTMRVSLGASATHKAGGRGAAGRHVSLVAYRDAWGSGAESYLQRMYERLVPMRDLLRDSGVLCLHCDWRSHAGLRLVLDEVFGPERFLNEIVWHYYNKYSAGTRHLPRAHDSLLLYARGSRPALNALRLPREEPRRQLVRENVDGVLHNARDAQGRLRYRTVLDRKADDVWRIPQLQPASAEWSGYATQKHHALLERMVALTTREGDLVADFFCGSGTTLTVAERMGRRWIGCDLGTLALHTARGRLLRDRAARPQGAPAFAIASLEDVARRTWLADTFRGDTEACRQHVLHAFGAQPAAPAAGTWADAWLDGAACLLPELDGACTPEHALSALRAAERAGVAQVYLLAWQYDPRFWSALPSVADGPVTLRPYVIPAALATPHGAAPAVFRALPRLAVHAELAGRYSHRRTGKRLVLTLADHQSGPARPAWSDGWEAAPEVTGQPLALLDGWCVDPVWRPGRPFRHAWWSVRSAHARDLAERSEPLLLNGGQPCVMALDVWGQATLHAFPKPDVVEGESEAMEATLPSAHRTR